MNGLSATGKQIRPGGGECASLSRVGQALCVLPSLSAPSAGATRTARSFCEKESMGGTYMKSPHECCTVLYTEQSLSSNLIVSVLQNSSCCGDVLFDGRANAQRFLFVCKQPSFSLFVQKHIQKACPFSMIPIFAVFMGRTKILLQSNKEKSPAEI